MKKHIIAPFLLLLVAAFVAAAQDNGREAQIAAQLAARRAAENGGGDATPANTADTGATNTADTGAANGADAGMPNGADADVTNTVNTGATNSAAADPEEIARQARIALTNKDLAASSNSPGNLASLQIIFQKNIFDPNRQPWVPGGPVRPPARVETWGVRGTSCMGSNGWVADFEGDGVPSYPPFRSVGQLVNGFKIKDITFSNVTLIDTKATTNAEQVWDVPGYGKGQQGVSRNDGGPWKPAYYTVEYAMPNRGPRQADNGMGGPQFPPVPTMMADNNPAAFNFGGNAQDDNSGGFGGGRNRQRGGGGPGGGRGGRQPGGGGFGGFGGGGGGGNANASFAPPTVVDPNAPIDPAVLQRLQQRRQQEQ
jgi:uncharacterized membrane protein YgcG